MRISSSARRFSADFRSSGLISTAARNAGQGLVEVALPEVGDAAVVVGRLRARMALQHLAEGGEHQVVVALLRRGRAQVVPGDGEAGADLEQRAEGGDRLVEVAPVVVGEAQPVARRRPARVERHHALEAADRVRDARRAVVGEPEPVVPAGADRDSARARAVDADRVVETSDVVVEIADVQQDLGRAPRGGGPPRSTPIASPGGRRARARRRARSAPGLPRLCLVAHGQALRTMARDWMRPPTYSGAPALACSSTKESAPEVQVATQRGIPPADDAVDAEVALGRDVPLELGGDDPERAGDRAGVAPDAEQLRAAHEAGGVAVERAASGRRRRRPGARSGGSARAGSRRRRRRRAPGWSARGARRGRRRRRRGSPCSDRGRARCAW